MLVFGDKFPYLFQKVAIFLALMLFHFEFCC